MSESEPAAITTKGRPQGSVREPGLLLFNAGWEVFPVSFESAFTSFSIFSAMAASSASDTSLLDLANICAANLATLEGLQTKALEEPGGLVKQLLFMPSGGQEIT